MTRLQRKGVGQKQAYVTRAKAIRYLQLSPADFRRVCILKGVYPQVPAQKTHGSTTYYYRKDIAFLSHDPIIAAIRGRHANDKKVLRLLRRGEEADAKVARAAAPYYTLDHVVRERYPTFEAALADLDDALCLVFLVSYLPSGIISHTATENCRRLGREWDAYVAASGSLSRVFVSTKGYYYQAEVHGVQITWVVPHKFRLDVPPEVDLRIFKSFAEFYQVLLGFVLFRLYRMDLGAEYPPRVPEGYDYMLHLVNSLRVARRALVDAARADRADGARGANGAGVDTDGAPDGSAPADNTPTVPPLPADQQDRIFSNLRFHVSREVPREPLEIVLLSGGADMISMSAAPADVEKAPLTHCIVDRPPHNIAGVAGQMVAGREYVQPQWAFDSLNAGVPLPPGEYKPGEILPPHVSPFASAEDGEYVPDRVRELGTLVAELRGKTECVSVLQAVQNGLAGAGEEGAAPEGLDDSAARDLARKHAASVAEEIAGSAGAGGPGSPESPENRENRENSDSSESEPTEREEVTLKPSTVAAEREDDETRMRKALLASRKRREYAAHEEEERQKSERRLALERRKRDLEAAIALRKRKIAGEL